MATRKVKRFNEDGYVEDDSRDYGGSSGSGDYAPEPATEDVAEKETPAKPANFKAAFAAARSAGDKTFEFNGKKYTTELASSKPAAKPASTSTNSRIPVPEAVKTEPAKPKYQSLQDRAKSYEAERAKSGVGMYGTKKSEPKEERKPLPLKSTKSETGYTGMGSLKFAKGGMTASSRADGIATRGKTKCKMY